MITIVVLVFHIALIHAGSHTGRWRRKIEPLPSFFPKVGTDVQEYLGEPAYLHCKVSNQGNYEVTWLRHSDNHLLYIGTVPFTNDQRFYVSHREEGENDWCLTIKDAQISDAGIYECQLSTTPIQRLQLTLTVLAHSAQISGKQSVETGSKIVIKCTVKKHRWDSKEPKYALWTKNDNMLNIGESFSRFKSKVDRINGTIVHTLIVSDAQVEDTGDYGCQAEATPATSLFVTVNGCHVPEASIGLIIIAVTHFMVTLLS